MKIGNNGCLYGFSTWPSIILSYYAFMQINKTDVPAAAEDIADAEFLNFKTVQE